MRLKLMAGFAFVLAAGLAATPGMASRVRRGASSGHSHTHHHLVGLVKTHKSHGQQTIDSERVTAIQQALIREHYLSGDPTTHWDGETQQAMVKFQADQGWQTKLTPDSRALIKLGLGPDHSKAMNASESANFNVPISAASPVDGQTQSAGFLAGSGVSH